MSDILKYNYWEHIKAEKELSFVLPPNHPKIIEIHKSAEEILKQINKN